MYTKYKVSAKMRKDYRRDICQRLKPKLLTTLNGYNKEQFLGDVTAGIIVAIIALPLSIALGISSGVTPEKGLFTRNYSRVYYFTSRG